MMIRSLFISKSFDELTHLKVYCQQNNIHLEGYSLIRFEPVEFHTNYDPDVIFFSSIRSANFFLEQKLSGKSFIAACIGEQTADKLRKKGLNVGFVGKNAGDPTAVAKTFKSWLGDKRVLFPCSDRSHHSISSELNENQYKEIVVYKTLYNPLKIEKADLYVFTSPSNFDSFMLGNYIPDGAKIIAWGKTTAKQITKTGLKVSYILKDSGEEEVINWLLLNKE